MTRASSDLAACNGVELWRLSTVDLVDEVHAAQGLMSQALAVFLGRVAEVDRRGLAQELQATSTAVWLGGALRVRSGLANQWMRLVKILDTYPALGSALADGVVNPEQVLAMGLSRFLCVRV